jgi:fatty acid desaturase
MYDKQAITRLAHSRYRSLPRMAFDVALWVGAAVLASGAHRLSPLAGASADAAAIAFIGAIPMHDLLFHGHEGVHGHIARNRTLNNLTTRAVHALFGLSATGYRRFHLEHHRHTHTVLDPEVRLVAPLGARGWAWLAAPILGYWYVNVEPLVRAPEHVRRRVVGELVSACALHVALLGLLGTLLYGRFVVLPMATSLAAVVVLRSLSEHHGRPTGDRWTHTRALDMACGWIWSNATYHLEHHLFPGVPYHELPAVRRILVDEYRARGVAIERGFWATAVRLLAHPNHFSNARSARALVRAARPEFRMKVALFRDILRSPAARKYLWSVYYTGEAYEELHPDGHYAARLPRDLGRLLTRHLDDESRHATVFRTLLEREGASPARLARVEDVGWHGLNTAVPDVVERARHGGQFSDDQAMRYMAFLHALELRSISDLIAVAQAARELGDLALADSIDAILRDERFHATYTLHAVYRLAGDRGKARRVLGLILRAERFAYKQSMRAIFRRLRETDARPRNLWGRARWAFMRLAVASGLAFERLPLYERLPRPLVTNE